MNRESATSKLPANLLQAISSPSGGRVVLVLGAGCSNESPTALPLAGDLSAECHRKLVADGILSEGEVNDRRDLSAVAEAVVQKTGSQRDLIERFPPDAFRNVKPNEGYLIMAALLIEGVLTDTLTLNFDFAARTALAHLGAGAKVSTVRGPEDYTRLGARNLIYLHRDIDSSPDGIILRTTALEEAWQGHWEETIAQRVLAGPIVVFVGLGSPASVLVETTKRIIRAIGKAQVSVYVVDPLTHEDSRFASALEIATEDYLRMGWGEFMCALAQRVVEEHRAAVEHGCEFLIQDHGIETEDVADLCSRLAEVGLVRLGQLRAAWMLHNEPYLPHGQGGLLHHFSNLVLAIRMVERISGRQAEFGEDGLVDFCRGGYVTRAMVCSGGGLMTGARVEAELSRRREVMQRQGRAPSLALVAGVEPGQDIVTPSDIIADADPDDLVTGPARLWVVNVAKLLSNPELISEMIR